LGPQDGEKIQAAIVWKEFLFIFKETKFYVFSEEGQDSSGNPIFNRRAVRAGVGLASPRAVCAHHTGLYFMDRTGIYGGSRACAWAIGDNVIGHSTTAGHRWAWQTRAWSRGEREPAAVLYQSAIVTPADPGVVLGGRYYEFLW
jgi:hypothetical protein